LSEVEIFDPEIYLYLKTMPFTHPQNDYRHFST